MCITGLFLVVALGVGFGACRAIKNHNEVPVAVVIPHHDMVASTRQAFLKEVAEKIQPKTVVIISPDHFDQAKEPIITTDKNWDTSLGEIKADRALIKAIGVPVDSKPYETEHGVTSLLKDTKTYFPDSMIVPVLLKRSATFAQVNDFIQNLNTQCPDCLLIASVDFSHTSDALVANLHDQLALRGLFNTDAVVLYKEAEVDSPEALTALTLWANLHNAKRFNLFSHTNSGFLTQAKSGAMTTHIIGSYTRGQAIKPVPSVTFMVGGDTMFGRGVATHLKQNEAALETLGERFFWGADVSLVNLEGVFVDSIDTEAVEDFPPKLLFDKKYSEALKYLHLTGVSVANNHHNDAGVLEARKSDDFLIAQNFNVIGTDTNLKNSNVLIKENGAEKVVFMSVYTHEPFSNLIEQIAKYSNDGYHVVIFAHWGEEYALLHNQSQQTMAEDWIDAGADLVVGSHPHVVQDVAVYKGRPIVYSLGNFLFDQNQSEKTQVGAVVSGIFTDGKLDLFLVPIQNYLEPGVLSNLKYEAVEKEWIKAWRDYVATEGQFTFTLD